MSYIPGPIYKTRFPELGFTKIEPGCWRFVDLSDADNPALVGSQYPTKEQLLSNLERYAGEYGCEGADKPQMPGGQGDIAEFIEAIPANIGKRVAREYFARKGNNAEAHISEDELAMLLTETVKLYQTARERIG